MLRRGRHHDYYIRKSILDSRYGGSRIPAVLAEKYGRNSKLMAEGVTLTTILSLVTIPIAASLLPAYYC
ncbi:MAG: hypothetical protein ACI4LJ_09520 [Anaerovoracaceae bacterium]